MKYFNILVTLLAVCSKADAVPCGPIPASDPQFFDLDGDSVDDARYRQDIGVISVGPNPTKEALRYITALNSVRFLRVQGTRMVFSLGQTISAANSPQVNSGINQIVLTDYYTIDYGGFFKCGYTDSPNTWNTLTNGIAGIRLQQDDGFHYGWIRFARPDLEPATPFAVVDYAYNPIPGAPIAAGEPPPLPPLQVATGETGLMLSWDARFPGLQLEWAESLEEPVNWQPVAEAAEGSAVVPPADANRFYRLRRP